MTETGSISIQRSGERAYFDHDWLKTYHSFSFAEYNDPHNQHWGALRVFNDDTVKAGKGFGTHPHRDMEILTYVLEGELEHKDSLGNIGVVRPGGVQYLSAGTGVAHSEYDHSSQTPVHFVQMWVVPRGRGLKPRYGQVDFTREERLNRWLPIASGLANVASQITIWQDAAGYVSRLEGGTLTHTLAVERFGFLFIASGSATLNGQTMTGGDAARITGPIELTIMGADAELVFWDVPGLT